uniref:Uncharacterized protein n=1 Tax=Rhizophora mucronata TaxID=61149 RepID=A0A2P2PU28_RHIMU
MIRFHLFTFATVAIFFLFQTPVWLSLCVCVKSGSHFVLI